MMKPFLEVTLYKDNVVSKRVLNKVESFTSMYVYDGGACWDSPDYRLALENVLSEDIEYTNQQDKVLESWKVVCNDRNNTIDENKLNIYTLEVYYRQINCLITTKLTYKIKWFIVSDDKSFRNYEESW